MNLLAFVKKRFGGKIFSGCHSPDGKACILEACSIARGLKWTDSPATIGMPDLRPYFEADVDWIKHYGFKPWLLPSVTGGLS